MSERFLIVFILGIILTAVGFGLFRRESTKKRRYAVPADAVIIDIMPCDRAHNRFRAVYEYTAYGHTVRMPGRRTAASPRAFTVGRTAAIRYDPHRPTEFVPVTGFDKAARFLSCGILGIVVTLASFLLLI